MSSITFDHCVQVLRKKLGRNDFSILDYSLKMNPHFLGFCSSQACLAISAVVDGRENNFTFFVKAITEKPDLNEKFWSVQRVFLKEYLVRVELIPNLMMNSLDKITADMYSGDPDSFIVLEDLTITGYELCRAKSLDLEHARLGMKSLANLHASSIVLERQNNESLGVKYKDAMFETLLCFPNGKNSPCFLYSMVKAFRIFAGNLVDNIDSETKNKIIDRGADRIVSFSQPSQKHLNVICHGDAWGNNLLYSYKEDKPISAILIDFQALRYAPPALDIMFYLFTAIPSEFRITHFNDLIQSYYEYLTDYLQRSSLKIDEILPEKAFRDSIEDYKEFGVLIKAFYFIVRLPAASLTAISESAEKYLGALVYGEPDVFYHALSISDDCKKDAFESFNELFKFYLNN